MIHACNEFDLACDTPPLLYRKALIPPPPTPGTPTQELAELGGGGHETICASVQEHIADTYMGHGAGASGAQGVLSGGGSYSGSSDTGKDGRDGARRGGGGSTIATPKQATTGGPPGDRIGRAGGGIRQARQVPWTVDPNGGVWTSTPPPAPPPTPTPPSRAPAAGSQGVAAAQHKRKGKRRGGGGAKSGAVVRMDVVVEGGELHQASVRLCGGDSGGGGDGAGLKRNSCLQTEEDLDKAQVFLLLLLFVVIVFQVCDILRGSMSCLYLFTGCCKSVYSSGCI